MKIGGRRREGTKRVKGLSVVSKYNQGQVSVGANIIQVPIFCQSSFLGHPLSPQNDDHDDCDADKNDDNFEND